ncbi:MAG: hypothetical protein HC927_06790, partial [Deltaproteobacteria bacterium]|nr:hypothetical protein [Deltaproteobacteria bacterium]
TESDLLIRLAPHLSAFIAELFNIGVETSALAAQIPAPVAFYEFNGSYEDSSGNGHLGIGQGIFWRRAL